MVDLVYGSCSFRGECGRYGTWKGRGRIVYIRGVRYLFFIGRGLRRVDEIYIVYFAWDFLY